MTFFPSRSFLLDVARGRVAKTAIVRRFGINADIDTASEEDVLALGGDAPWNSSAQSLEAVSDSTDDVSGSGTGARTIRVRGLNGAYADASETVSMNGTTPVNLSNTYVGDIRAELLTAGSGETNAGNITIRIQSAGASQALMPAGFGRSLASTYIVPANKTAYLIGWSGSLYKAVSASYAELRLMVADDTVGWRLEALHELNQAGISAYARFSDDMLIPLPAKTRVRVRAKVSVNDTGVSSDFQVVLIG